VAQWHSSVQPTAIVPAWQPAQRVQPTTAPAAAAQRARQPEHECGPRGWERSRPVLARCACALAVAAPTKVAPACDRRTPVRRSSSTDGGGPHQHEGRRRGQPDVVARWGSCAYDPRQWEGQGPPASSSDDCSVSCVGKWMAHGDAGEGGSTTLPVEMVASHSGDVRGQRWWHTRIEARCSDWAARRARRQTRVVGAGA
jgi:hypothetical protein